MQYFCDHTTGCVAYDFTADGYGVFNVRTNLCVCWTREGGVRHKRVCTRVDSEGQKSRSSPCPARGSNPGSSDLNSDALTTELRHPQFLTMDCGLWVPFVINMTTLCLARDVAELSQGDCNTTVGAICYKYDYAVLGSRCCWTFTRWL